MNINDSEIEDAISHLGEMETDEDAITDTGDSDDTDETVEILVVLLAPVRL